MPTTRTRPRTEAQADAARRNGARSRGPVTPAGKARSARNAVVHAMYAVENIVLAGEDGAEFDRMRGAMAVAHGCQGPAEQSCLQRMATSVWRQHRAEAMERALFDECAAMPTGPLGTAEGQRRLALLLRWQQHLRAEFHRALAELRRLQKDRDGLEVALRERVEEVVAMRARTAARAGPGPETLPTSPAWDRPERTRADRFSTWPEGLDHPQQA